MSAIEKLEARVRELEERLRAVEDIEAIKRLKARYGALADSRYDRSGVRPAADLAEIADALGDLFTEDAVWDGGAGLGLCEGREAIRERFRNPTLSFSWHYFVKPEIRVEGDEARGRWDILAPFTSADGRAMWMSGVEDDEYARVDGRWLHKSMSLRVVFTAPHDRGWAKRGD